MSRPIHLVYAPRGHVPIRTLCDIDVNETTMETDRLPLLVTRKLCLRQIRNARSLRRRDWFEADWHYEEAPAK